MDEKKLFFLATFVSCLFILNCSVIQDYNGKGTLDENVAQNASLLPYARKGEEVCMKALGCIKFTNDFFHPLFRPFNFLPNDRVVINTEFHLYTRRNPKEHITLRSDDPTSIKKSPIDPKAPTKFIIHGFVDNRLYGKWMDEMKDNLLLHGEYNVFIVDWSGGNSPPYAQATANTLVVGAEVSHMIKTLQKLKGVSPMDCHIIGHSLGSHIAGYAGKKLVKQRLGRISAVDPAQPFFENMPAPVRVDRTDADFVDVIHTDSQTIFLLGLGMTQAVGHVDFYPNEGKHQPGCKTDVIRSIFLEGLLDASRRFVACNHQRAVDFYTYSINYRRATPVGYECPSWKDYTSGNCAECGRDGGKCAIMGIRADEYRPMKNNSRSLKLYLSTSGSAPYWTYQYHVTLKLSKPKKQFADQEGKISLVLHGENSLKVGLTPDPIKLYHGTSYKFLITAKKTLGAITSVTFSWENSSWNIFKRKEIHVDFLKIVPMNIIDKTERKVHERTFCDKPDRALKPGTLISLSTHCPKY